MAWTSQYKFESFSYKNTNIDAVFKVRCCRADYLCVSRISNRANQKTRCNYGDVRADHTNCRNYYVCEGEDPHYEMRQCPNGKMFNGQLGQCVSTQIDNECQSDWIHGETSETSTAKIIASECTVSVVNNRIQHLLSICSFTSLPSKLYQHLQ